MVEPGAVLEAPTLGVRFEFRRTAAETGGEYTEMDVIGRPRGFIAQPHVHPGQVERHEVIDGRHGDPPARAHAGARARRVRRDAGRAPPTATWPPARAGARAPDGHARRPDGGVRGAAGGDGPGGRASPASACRSPCPARASCSSFVDDAHAASPPPRVQRAIADTVLKAAELALQRVRLRRRVGRRRAARGRPRRGGRRLDLPRVVAADVHQRPHRGPGGRRAGQPPPLPRPAALHAQGHHQDHPLRAAGAGRDGGGRRSPRHRHLDADPGATAGRTCASTGACSRTARSCASSRPSCGRSSAGTTAGRSRAPRRGWSPTRGAGRPRGPRPASRR